MLDENPAAPVDTTSLIKMWFELGVPLPTTKNLHTQLGCHFEEVVEMIDCLDSSDALTVKLVAQAGQAMVALADHLKASDGVIHVLSTARTDMLDAICDQAVTGIGVAHMLAMNPSPALEEVNRSNWSKFVDGKPIFNENQKIMKGYKYTQAELSGFV